MHLSRRIKEFRTMLGLSVDDLANIIDKSRYTVIAYESGARNPSVPTIRRMIKLATQRGLNIGITWFYPE